MSKTITLAHGNGGAENNELITKVFYKAFKNDILSKSEDAAVIQNGTLAFSTDSFTVSPLFFNGANIGKLAVCGTCNDLAMMGAKPKYLTCSVIIEEGFEIRELEKIVKSMKEELEVNGAIVVSGDTKVVPKGSVAMADSQTAIYPQNSPGGWNIIGKTALELFDKNLENLSIFEVGNKVKFNSISKEEFLSQGGIL